MLRGIEREVGVGVAPLGFANRASIMISAQQSRDILRGMGIIMRSSIRDPRTVSEVLDEMPRLSTEQIQYYVEQARNLMR